jgi:hypothetical protein
MWVPCGSNGGAASLLVRYWFVLFAASSSTSNKNSNKKLSLQDQSFISSISSNPATTVVIIDAENVRGKSNFELSHSDLLTRTALWAQRRHLSQGQVTLVVDHGSLPTGYVMTAPAPAAAANNNIGNSAAGSSTSNGGSTTTASLGVVFAGPSMKADDVIARDIPFFQQASLVDGESLQGVNKIVVVTSDSELSDRCLRAAGISSKMVHIVQSIRFLNDMDRIMMDMAVSSQTELLTQQDSSDNWIGVAASDTTDASAKEQPTSNSTTTITTSSSSSSLTAAGTTTSSQVVVKVKAEIQLLGQILALESQLRKRTSHKKQHRLSKQLRQLREQLASKGGTSLLNQVTAVHTQNSPLQALAREEQDAIMDEWEKRKWRKTELTGDRVLLAERLRRHLERDTITTIDNDNASNMNSTSIVALSTTSATPTNDISANTSSTVTTTTPPSSVAQQYVDYFNTLLEGEGVQKKPMWSPTEWSTRANPTNELLGQQKGERPPLRMVVVSDTHGYEAALTTAPAAEGEESKSSSSKLIPWSLVKDSSAWEAPASFSRGNEGHRHSVLPAADVLLHLGDFAIDGGGSKRRQRLMEFDKWLAAQPHPVKLVLRGNHDPVDVDFSLSGAKYVTRAEAVNVHGWVLGLVGYKGLRFSNKNKHHGLALPPCDILASHEPPKAVLDKCLNGDRVGSSILRSSVERMTVPTKKAPSGQPPKLWFCGHIHEGRGIKRLKMSINRQGGGFADASTTSASATKLSPPQQQHTHAETIVINAANANPGRATGLVHGPIVVELQEKEDLSTDPRFDDSFTKFDRMIQKPSKPTLAHQYDQDHSGDVKQLLVAVDMGLKTGVSIYSQEGTLLRYFQLQFANSEELRQRMPHLLQSWESSINQEAKAEIAAEETSESLIIESSSSSKIWQFTHVAIEGGEASLWKAWQDIVEQLGSGTSVDGDGDEAGQEESPSQEQSNHNDGPLLFQVRPEEWRRDLLTAKEKQTKSTTKAAARQIAKQLVADFSVGEQPHEGKIQTDAAESIVMGFYVAQQLGWIARTPAIRRYSNKSVMLPK